MAPMTKEFELYRSANHTVISEETQMGDVELFYWKYLVIFDDKSVVCFFSRNKDVKVKDVNREHQIYGNIVSEQGGSRMARMENRNTSEVSRFLIENNSDANGRRVKHFAISNEVFDLSEFILLADSK
jgi:hypothetical protein